MKIEANRSEINHIVAADAIVRNDEVVGSIPTSSTNFSSKSSYTIVLQRVSTRQIQSSKHAQRIGQTEKDYAEDHDVSMVRR
jgi:hypothetical protein